VQASFFSSRTRLIVKENIARMPNLFLIAGPSGAGKSTSAPELLSGARRVAEFVNADVIAKEQGVSEIQAGRITLNRLTALAAARQDMAFETTLASHLLLPRIRSYSAVADSWTLFDNAASLPARRIAWRDVGEAIRIGDNGLWRQLVVRYMKPRVEQQEAIAAPEKLWTSEDLLDAVNRGVRAALKRHKELGQSKPEEIEI
jgi:DNA polymerase III delta prime subunit